MPHFMYTKKDFAHKPVVATGGFFGFIKGFFKNIYIIIARKRSERRVQKMLKDNFVNTQTKKKVKIQKKDIYLSYTSQSLPKMGLVKQWRGVAAVFSVLFLTLTILTSQYYGPQFIEAEILVQNFTEYKNIVTDGIKLLKYETLSTSSIDSKAEFDAETYSSGNFETGEDDLIAYTSTDDYLELGHYGDNPPDTSETDWWDDNSYETCSSSAFGNGSHSDTQYDGTDDWLELDATGLTSGTGTYTSEIFDAGSSVNWSTLSWIPHRPTYKELIDNLDTEIGYGTDNVDMTNNTLLVHLNESSGTIANTSGVTNDGTYNGALYSQPGRFNTSIGFDGVDDQIDFGQDLSQVIGGSGSIAFWMNTTQTGSDTPWDAPGITGSEQASTGNDVFWGYITASGYIAIQAGNTAGAVSTTSVNDGSWHHVVLTRNHVSGVVQVYVDGSLEDTATSETGVKTQYFNSIGRIYDSAGVHHYYQGDLDEVSFWSDIMSSTEAFKQYRRGANRIKFQVRSCNDDACSGETFIGPDGTASTYYTEETNHGLYTPTVALASVSDNQYFQYQTVLETDNSSISPELECVTINTSDDYNWRYRKCFEIDHTDSDAEDQTEYQIYLDIDTDDFVTDGKMQSDGDDIRFVDSDNNLLDYYIADDMNEDSTRIWLQMDNIDEGETEDICMYYGNSSASGMSSREDVFTYSTEQDIYHVVADSADSGQARFVSYVDNNDIAIETYDETLDEFEFDVFPEGFTQTTEISTLAPIGASFQGAGTDAIVPKSFAGTDFTYRMDRGTNEFSIVSPWCNASIAMENGSGNTISGSPFTVNAGNSLNVTTNNTATDGLPNNDMVIIEESGSDCPVLITHHSTTNQDSFAMYPASEEWYGVGSSSVEISAMEDTTSVTVYRSGGTSSTHSMDRGDELTINDSGSDGSDPAHRVVADKKIGVKAIADSDGNESVTFLPPEEMDYKYYIPQDVQYIAIATTEGVSTTVDLWEDGTSCGVGTADDTSTVTPSSTYPGKIYFGDTAEGLEYDAGACLVADNPIFVYYEYEDTDDETNLWSMKQNRQYISPAPSYTVGTQANGTWRMGLSAPDRWRSRRAITITNNSTTALSEYQIKVNIDGLSDIFTNSQTDGGDLRVAGSTGDGTDDETYWLENYDATNEEGDVWVQFDTVAASSTATLYLYYRHNPGSSETTTGDEEDVFSYSSAKNIFMVVDSDAADNTLDIISFTDDNTVGDGSTTTDLDEGEMTTLPSESIGQDSIFSVLGPIHASFGQDTTDAAIPISYAGKEFVYNAVRNSDVFSFYAPFADASIQIQQSSGTGWTTLQTVNLSTGNAVTVSQDITNGRAFKIVSDEDILAFHRNGVNDSKIMYPTRLGLEEDSGDYELYGIGSGSVRLASSSDASVTVYRSDGTSTAVTLSSSNNFVWNESGSGDQGTARGYHIVSDAPIGAMSYDDGDGGEMVVFVSQKEFSYTYALSDDAQYLAMVAKDASVTCKVYDDGGTEVTTGSMDNVPPQTGGTRTLPYVNNIHIGGDDTADGAYFNAGYSMVCSEPVYAYYEHHVDSTITDETSWLTWPQVRKYATTEPDVEDPDDIDEEGLYYESGFDSAGSGTDPEAYMEFIVDTSALTYGEHVVWESIEWEEIVNNRSAENSVKQTEYEISYADASPSCAAATYSSWETITPVTTSSTADTSISYVTYYTNEKMTELSDEFSDHPCLKVRAYLRTGDEAYSPRINNIDTNYYIPTLLEDQLNSPTIDVVGATSGTSERYRVLKAVTTETDLNGSQVFTTYADVSDGSVFSQADLEFLEIPSQTTNGQFAFPPFPGSTPVDAATQSSFDSSNDVALYFTHERSTGSTETMDFVFNVDIVSAGGPQISRDFQLNISGL